MLNKSEQAGGVASHQLNHYLQGVALIVLTVDQRRHTKRRREDKTLQRNSGKKTKIINEAANWREYLEKQSYNSKYGTQHPMINIVLGL